MIAYPSTPGLNEEAENGMIKVWPIDKNNVARKWAIGRNSVDERNQKGLLVVTKNSKSNLYEIKHAPETTPVKSLWYDKKYDANVFGTKLLTQVLGKKIEDMYPKSIYTLEECIKITLKDKKEAKIFSPLSRLTYYGLFLLSFCVCRLYQKKKEKKKCSFSEYTQQNRIIIVKKKPCLNDRDENPLKPLDKD